MLLRISMKCALIEFGMGQLSRRLERVRRRYMLRGGTSGKSAEKKIRAADPQKRGLISKGEKYGRTKKKARACIRLSEG